MFVLPKFLLADATRFSMLLQWSPNHELCILRPLAAEVVSCTAEEFVTAAEIVAESEAAVAFVKNPVAKSVVAVIAQVKNVMIEDEACIRLSTCVLREVSSHRLGLTLPSDHASLQFLGIGNHSTTLKALMSALGADWRKAALQLPRQEYPATWALLEAYKVICTVEKPHKVEKPKPEEKDASKADADKTAALPEVQGQADAAAVASTSILVGDTVKMTGLVKNGKDYNGYLGRVEKVLSTKTRITIIDGPKKDESKDLPVVNLEKAERPPASSGHGATNASEEPASKKAKVEPVNSVELFGESDNEEA